MKEERVIIYGYSVVGEAVYQECEARNIEVCCFCEDSRIRREQAETKVPLFSLSEISELETDAVFIICIVNVEAIIKKLSVAGYKKWFFASDYLTDKKYLSYSYRLKSREMAVREIESCILSQKYYRREDKVFVRNIDLEITEKCSLRCRDCCNLMQYYKKPKDYGEDDLVRWVRQLLEYVDEIYEVRVIGGEPFMHRSMHMIIEKLIQLPQIHRVSVYSNGTIMPDGEMLKVLKNEKVGFSITNYGGLSRNFSNMVDMLKENNIAYDIHDAGGWTQCSDIMEHGRSEDELAGVFRECCAKDLPTILDGKVYKCPFMANAVNLQAVPVHKEDFLDLAELKNHGLPMARRIVRDFFKGKAYYKSCDFCNGRPYDAEEIEAAVQILKPREYHMVGGNGCGMD